MSKIELRDGKLVFCDEVISLPHPVVKLVRGETKVFVMVEPPAGVVFNRGVYSLSHEGVILWQISESPHGEVKEKPYVDIFIDDRDRLIAANWIGIDYWVDVEDGSVEAIAFNR
ncbi:hypothetical protein ACX3YG_21675 [Pseudomonas wadenswilerensis]